MSPPTGARRRCPCAPLGGRPSLFGRVGRRERRRPSEPPLRGAARLPCRGDRDRHDRRPRSGTERPWDTPDDPRRPVGGPAPPAETPAPLSLQSALAPAGVAVPRPLRRSCAPPHHGDRLTGSSRALDDPSQVLLRPCLTDCSEPHSSSSGSGPPAAGGGTVGSSKRKMAPPPGGFPAHTDPPSACATWATIARPSPEPGRARAAGAR
jgi:hypothetical protein